MEKAMKKRPVMITIVCIIGYIWIVFSFPGIFSPSVKKLGDWYPALFGLLVACTFISYIGVWHMKRWGARLFVIAFFTKELLQILINDVGYVGIFISVFSIVTMAVFYRRMDLNL